MEKGILFVVNGTIEINPNLLSGQRNLVKLQKGVDKNGRNISMGES